MVVEKISFLFRAEKPVSYCLSGRKAEIKKESEVWTSDSADFNNGGV